MDRTENISFIFQCSLVAGEMTCPQSCSLATAVLLSPVYTAVTCQWVYISHRYDCTLVFLSVCTVITAVEAICKWCGRVFGCYSNPVPLCLFIYHITKTHGGNGSKDHCIFDLGLDRGGQLHASAALPPSREAPVFTGYEAGWAPKTGKTVLTRELS
jgi:hypothetical protein